MRWASYVCAPRSIGTAAFAIDWAPIWSPDDPRLEPIFLEALPWNEPEPFIPLGTEAAADELERSPAAAPERASPGAAVASLGMHLLPLLLLLGWHGGQGGAAEAIGVSLVFEQAAAAPAPTPDIVEPPAPEPRQAAVPIPPPKPTPVRKAAAVVTPKPPTPATPPPQPAATAEIKPAIAAGEPPPDPEPRAEAGGAAQPRTADAGQSDYFGRLVTLTRRHFDLLPLSVLEGRRGETVLSVIVRPDGTIASIAVKRSSGYPDIDARIEQMVAAVGRFPPLPQKYEGPSLDLDFRLSFPEALQQ